MYIIFESNKVDVSKTNRLGTIVKFNNLYIDVSKFYTLIHLRRVTQKLISLKLKELESSLKE